MARKNGGRKSGGKNGSDRDGSGRGGARGGRGEEAVAQATARLLADTYTLYLKTHNFHWNVTGPMFTTLHTLFETQYTELALAVDEIAERIRALGFVAPGSYAEFAKLSTVQDAKGVPPAMQMIRQLVADNETVAASAQAVFDLAEKAGDQATADLAVRRMQVAEKNAWMLRSHLE
jgi:starvation-inducible DNA-binding protein